MSSPLGRSVNWKGGGGGSRFVLPADFDLLREKGEGKKREKFKNRPSQII